MGRSGVAAVGATKIEGSAGARWTYTASGSVTNVAARISESAVSAMRRSPCEGAG